MSAVAVIGERERVEAMVRGPRLRLLEELRAQSQSASALAARIGLPRQTINYHLRQLEDAGLVELVEERGAGSCVERVLAPTRDAVGAPGRAHADRASAQHLLARATELVGDAAHLLSQKRQVATLTVETEIRFASAEARADFAAELAETIQMLARKYHDDETPGGRRFALLAAAYPTLRRKRAADERS